MALPLGPVPGTEKRPRRQNGPAPVSISRTGWTPPAPDPVWVVETSTPSDVLTCAEAAAVLRVTAKTLRAAVAAGQVPCCRVGRSLRFSRRALAAMVAGEEPAR